MKVQLFQKETYDAKAPVDVEETEIITRRVKTRGTSSFKAPTREQVNVSQPDTIENQTKSTTTWLLLSELQPCLCQFTMRSIQAQQNYLQEVT